MTASRPPPDIRALGSVLSQADDAKLLRITAMLDNIPVPATAQALLDPLRPRLANLKPSRPLRFARLLFIPIDPLIVPARSWRPGNPTVSRGGMAALSATVRAGLGSLSDEIDRMLAGHRSDETDVIEQAGSRLWPAAAVFLSTSPVPPPLQWDDTGLPIAAYPAIAQSLAIVLARASRIHKLVRDAEIGMLDPDEASVRALLHAIPANPPEGSAMVVRLILQGIPRSAPILRRMITMSQDSLEQRVLQRALDRGMEEMFSHMEDEAGLAKTLRHASVEYVIHEIKRLANLLEDFDDDPAMRRHRPRLKAIRDRVDATCQARFVDGMEDGLVTPLGTGAPAVDAERQETLEGRARALRSLEMVGRRIGGATKYDAFLAQAARTVEMAGRSGLLTPARMVRLVEILSGPEAAERLYLTQMARKAL